MRRLLSVTEYGEGRPVVILHGLFGSARNWASVARRLGEARRVLALDMRNHGESFRDAHMTYSAMAADVRQVIEHHGLDRPAVIGHSMGGKAAMVLALEHAEAVGGLVAVDIAPEAHAPDGLLGLVRAMQAVDLAGLKRRAEVEEQLARGVPDRAVRSFLLQSLASDGQGLRWRLNLAVLAAEMPTITGFPDFPDGVRYDGPALFVAGGRSDYVLPHHHPAILRLFPRAEFASIEGAGHWVHSEKPEELLAGISAFLDRMTL